MVEPLMRASMATQQRVALSSRCADRQQHARLRLGAQINAYEKERQVDWHQDNATPGPGGWKRNSQKEGTSVIVLTVCSVAGAHCSQELLFSHPGLRTPVVAFDIGADNVRPTSHAFSRPPPPRPISPRMIPVLSCPLRRRTRWGR